MSQTINWEEYQAARDARDAKIRELFKTHRQFFERINVADYEDSPETLYRDGESGVIWIGLFTYRYSHYDVDEQLAAMGDK